MEEMDISQAIEFMVYKYHSNPKSLIAADAVLNIHPDFVRFFGDNGLMKQSEIIKHKALFTHDLADSSDAYWYMFMTHDHDPKLIEKLAKNLYLAVQFSKNIIRTEGIRFPEIDAAIIHRLANYGPEQSTSTYLREVVKGRWPELEKMLLQAPTHSKFSKGVRDESLMEYAAHLYKSHIQLPDEILSIIKQDPDLVIHFTVETGTRHVNLERIIKDNPSQWSNYFYYALLRFTSMTRDDVDRLYNTWKKELKNEQS